MNTAATTTSVTRAARHFADFVNRAYYRRETTTLLKNGKPVARIVPMPPMLKSGSEIGLRLAGERPRLTVNEAEEFDADLRESREVMALPVSRWD